MKSVFFKIVIAGFLFLFSYTKIFAQNDIEDSIPEKLDDFNLLEKLGDTSLKKYQYAIEDDSMQEYRKDKDFAYMKYLDSLLRKTKDLKSDTFTINNANSFKRKNGNQNNDPQKNKLKFNLFNKFGVKIFLWLLAICFIGYVLYKLFAGGDFFKSNYKNKPFLDSQAREEVASDISAYDKLIAQAVVNKNFRLAVRYFYLQTLQRLSDSAALQLSADKTNFQYVNELHGKPYQNEFASVTVNYEYVWYGKFEINEETFKNLSNDFRAFSKKI